MKDLILIVEDNRTIAMYQKNVLYEMGLDVIVAHNLEDVNKLLDTYKSKITIAVVDINLPDCEDCVLDKLLKLNIPCIAMTGSFHKELRDKVIDKKLIDYIILEDDHNLELLRCTINRILNNKYIKILIVDDSKSTRYALRDLLQHQNYTVLEANDALEAMKIMQEHDNIKMALIDYEMPGMNGADLARVIRKNLSRMEFSILAISAHSDTITTIEFLKAGANDFITKPFVKEEAIARISVNLDMIDQHRLIQEEINERKKIEEQLIESQKKALLASSAKSDFLASMSHEIRTPLNAILGFIEILFKEEESERKRSKLQIIKESSKSLMTIINDILDIAKIESGKLEIENTLFVTKSPFIQTTELFYEKAQDKNIQIMLNIDENLPTNAYGDITRIGQVYSNLLSNAIKFSDDDSSIEVDINFDKDSNSLRCYVQDHGIGIAPENIDRIFSAFEQEDNTTTRKFGGTGLGLSICKTLIGLMNGEIGVTSVLGSGSSFFFIIFPFDEKSDKSKDNYLVEHKKSEDTNNISLAGTILLVEDNKSNQMLMQILLNELGLEVVIADDGLKAVEEFKRKSFSLILMDENMPNMNGIEATKIIRKLEKGSRNKATPIIAVTANALKGDKDRFLNIGMDDYISKPVDNDELIKVLSRFLDQVV